MSQDDLFNTLMELSNTVIYVEEVQDHISKEVFDLAIKNRDEFIKQIEARVQVAKNEKEVVFAKEVALNFLIFSLKMLIADLDDENIRRLGNHIHKQIISLVRE